METNKINKNEKQCVIKFEAVLSEYKHNITISTEGTCSQEILNILNNLDEKPKSKGFFS